MSGAAVAFDNDDEVARLRWWLARYRHGEGGRTWGAGGGESSAPRLRLSGRGAMGFTELGSPFDQEAGLAWSSGWNATFEPVLDLATGRWWISATGRLTGQVAASGIDFSDPGRSTSPLTWPGWSIPTGKSQVRDARLQGDRWIVDVPRAVAGLNLGNWSLSAGWVPRSTGPALTGAIALDQSGPSFPAFTARRTKPLEWGSGFLSFLAPDELLMSTGRLSERLVRSRDENEILHEKMAHPWFFQWLVGWRVTSWFRATFTHAAMAAPREGSLGATSCRSTSRPRGPHGVRGAMVRSPTAFSRPSSKLAGATHPGQSCPQGEVVCIGITQPRTTLRQGPMICCRRLRHQLSCWV